MPPRIAVRDISFFERQVPFAKPFRFGAVVINAAAQAFVRVEIEVEGKSTSVGASAELMAPKCHQSDGGDGTRRSKWDCGLASSRSYVHHGKLKGSRVHGFGRPFCWNWRDCAVRLADSLAKRWAV